SRFLSRFHDLKEFDDFTKNFISNPDTRIGLPLLLKEEIHGFGFALACDFLKENVNPKFVKPDTHIKDIFKGICISKSNASDFEVFTDVVKFSECICEVPYRVDKLFWLVGSGKFYLQRIGTKENGELKTLEVRTDKRHFIEAINKKYGEKLAC
ncbi:unnamed protein product, partial [marine sediment metagenome]